MSHIGGEDGGGVGLWDEEDKFFYDVLHLPDGRMQSLRIRSMVGLIPLLRWRRWSRSCSTGFPSSNAGSSGS